MIVYLVIIIVLVVSITPLITKIILKKPTIKFLKITKTQVHCYNSKLKKLLIKSFIVTWAHLLNNTLHIFFINIKLVKKDKLWNKYNLETIFKEIWNYLTHIMPLSIKNYGGLKTVSPPIQNTLRNKPMLSSLKIKIPSNAIWCLLLAHWLCAPILRKNHK
jgi:hypothetical protein